MSGDFEKLIKLTEQLIDQEKADRKELERLVANTADGYWDWHIAKDCEYMSPRFWEILHQDYKLKKHRRSESMQLVHPDDLAAMQLKIKEHFESFGSIPFVCEARFYAPDGSLIYILCKGASC